MRKDILVITSCFLILIGTIIFYESTRTPAFRLFPDKEVVDTTSVNKSIPDSLSDLRKGQLDLSNQIDSYAKEKETYDSETRPNYMGIIVAITLILGSLVPLGKLGLDFVALKVSTKQSEDLDKLTKTVIEGHKEIKDRLDKNDSQHAEIFEVLVVVKDEAIKKDFAKVLREIPTNIIHLNRKYLCTNVKRLVAAQAERVVIFSEQIMSEELTSEMYDLACIKIDDHTAEGLEQARKLLGDGFMETYQKIQANANEHLKDGLKRIVDDKLFNSKYARYKRVAEEFLEELIMDTINEYAKFIKTRKCQE